MNMSIHLHRNNNLVHKFYYKMILSLYFKNFNDLWFDLEFILVKQFFFFLKMKIVPYFFKK